MHENLYKFFFTPSEYLKHLGLFHKNSTYNWSKAIKYKYTFLLCHEIKPYRYFSSLLEAKNACKWYIKNI